MMKTGGSVRARFGRRLPASPMDIHCEFVRRYYHNAVLGHYARSLTSELGLYQQLGDFI